MSFFFSKKQNKSLAYLSVGSESEITNTNESCHILAGNQNPD